jgi:hypothetical protein
MIKPCQSCGDTSTTPARLRQTGACACCKEPRCFHCGCTAGAPCLRPATDGVYPCSWVSPGECSFCVSMLVEAEYRVAAGHGADRDVELARIRARDERRLIAP